MALFSASPSISLSYSTILSFLPSFFPFPYYWGSGVAPEKYTILNVLKSLISRACKVFATMMAPYSLVVIDWTI